MSHTAEDLRALQAKTLEEKIQISTARIIEWYEHWNGQVYVSFSGGKDSTVLLDLVRRVYPDVPAVFSDTGLEFPEITAQHFGAQGIARSTSAVETERFMNIPKKAVKAKPIAKPKDPYSPAMKAAFKEKTGYDFDGIPEVMKQRELKS